MSTEREVQRESQAGWETVIPKLEPLIFQVHAGDSIGTAFAIGISRGDGGRHTMLVTALHVVESVLGSDLPLDLVDGKGEKVSAYTTGPVHIYPVGPKECDTALIQLPTREPVLPPNALLPLPFETMAPRGTSIGWLGFPGLVFPELCFFRGVVSGFREQPPIYLVDGVAINGVSGGPAFDRRGLIIGLISAYVPNQVSAGTTLPGLMIITPLNLVRHWMVEILGAEVQFRE
jgi:hypothetical protein